MKRTWIWLLSLCLLFSLTGCRKQEETPDVDLTAVREAMLEAQNTDDPYLLETDALLNLYGISSEDVAQSASFVTMSGTFPDEIILVQAVDDKAAERVTASLEARLNEVKIQSQTYDPDNYKAAQACKVETNGLYVSLILSPDQEALTAIYNGYFS